MSKFKFGDKVKFIGNSSLHADSEFLDDSSDFITITKVLDGGRCYGTIPYENCAIWLFDEDELELVNDNNYSFAFKCPTGEPGELGICETKENEEKKEMNKVLELWYKRKVDKIIKKYEKLEEEYTKKQYSVVESYNELIEQFERDLEDLYSFDKVTEQFVLTKSGYTDNDFKYIIDYDKIHKDFRANYSKDKENEIEELNKIKEEVEAQLSLSNDLQYQQEILERYNIITKKTKKISE